MLRCQKYLFRLLKKFRYCSLLGMVVFLRACNQYSNTLVNNVNQETANLIILELAKQQINTRKQEAKDGTFSILVQSKDQLRALEVLKANGLPLNAYDSLGSVFKKDSFISSPLEEQSRFIYALQQQVSDMISSMDGVVAVHCQISLAPSSDNLWKNDQIKPAAAVFIKYKEGFRLDIYVNRIKQLVANSVPGLTSDRVEVLTVTPLDN